MPVGYIFYLVRLYLKPHRNWNHRNWIAISLEAIGSRLNAITLVPAGKVCLFVAAEKGDNVIFLFRCLIMAYM